MITIGVLECWTNRAEWLERHGDFGDWFVTFLRKADADIGFRIHHAHKGDLPDDPLACDGWLVTGSAVSVNDEKQWQVPLGEFLKDAAAVRPVIGVCYGHQLLHRLFGGRVERAVHWGVGVHDYTVHDDAVSDRSSIRLLASHEDQVTHAAPDSRLLASSPFCAVAASAIGDNIITIQPHPELTVEMAAELYPFLREEIGGTLTEKAVESLARPIDDLTVARWMLDFVRTRRAETAEDIA